VFVVLAIELITYMEQSLSWEANSHSPTHFPTFYGTWRFITVFTRTYHWSLYWDGSNSRLPHSISLSFILILFSQLWLGLLSGVSPVGFPTKILYAFSTETVNPSILQNSEDHDMQHNNLPFVWVWNADSCLDGTTLLTGVRKRSTRST